MYALMYEERYGVQIDSIALLFAVEKSRMPLVYHDQASKYFKSVLKRIKQFHEETQYSER